MVKLTILSDELCKELGTVDADNMGSQLVVNPNKELCGAFVNTINLTLVNYTEKNSVDTEESPIKRWNYSFIFSCQMFLSRVDFSKLVLEEKEENNQQHGIFR